MNKGMAVAMVLMRVVLENFSLPPTNSVLDLFRDIFDIWLIE